MTLLCDSAFVFFEKFIEKKSCYDKRAGFSLREKSKNQMLVQHRLEQQITQQLVLKK